MMKKNRGLIKYLVMDVDGTLTDGKIYMGENGELFKAFDIKDGYGISEILPSVGIVPVIITARKSRIVENRCKELRVSHVYQGERNKIDRLISIIAEEEGVSNDMVELASVAYIGDDDLDLQCMIPIKKAGGVTGCPSDASNQVRAEVDFVSSFKGGNGAVREFIETIVGRNSDQSGNANDDNGTCS